MYQCTRCGYETHDRSSFMRHLKKKRPCVTQTTIYVIEQEVEKMYVVLANRDDENKEESDSKLKKMLEDFDLINRNLTDTDREKLKAMMDEFEEEMKLTIKPDSIK